MQSALNTNHGSEHLQKLIKTNKEPILENGFRCCVLCTDTNIEGNINHSLCVTKQ